MDAKEFLLTVQKECHGKPCAKCAFYRVCIHTSVCTRYEEIVDEAIKRAEKLNHKRTYADDFFEKFPNAKIVNGGTPAPCRDDVYGVKSASCVSMDCRHCWNEPYEEMEK